MSGTKTILITNIKASTTTQLKKHRHIRLNVILPTNTYLNIDSY